jgi:hypothetical protein
MSKTRKAYWASRPNPTLERVHELVAQTPTGIQTGTVGYAWAPVGRRPAVCSTSW